MDCCFLRQNWFLIRLFHYISFMFLLSLFSSLFLTSLNSWNPLNLKLVSSQFTIFLDSLSHWPFVIPALPILALLNPASRLISPVPCSGVFICHPVSSVSKLLPITVFSTHHSLSALSLGFYTSPSFVLFQSSCSSFSHHSNAISLNEVFPPSWTSLDSSLLFFSAPTGYLLCHWQLFIYMHLLLW